MEPKLRQRAMDCCSLDKSNIALACSLNVELGYAFADAVKKVCAKRLDMEQIAVLVPTGRRFSHPVDEGGAWPPTCNWGSQPSLL
jgi:anhydro-N-acetylmuramic acid kinase